MNPGEHLIPPDESGGDLQTRLHVLEMTVAAIAARLPKADLQEVVALLVFVAKGADAATQLEQPPDDTALLEEAASHATRMLDRIAKSRASERGYPVPLSETSGA
ncbi:hypothetical protein ACE7GA_09695 [Roseomonas sp. CCTCC AB2023176]|uniref:hypothetical protein n=1 Tax=Roseomonas sp. CCTCC AB2023176 TaxID=3342640 RepID=UPI0035DF7E4B